MRVSKAIESSRSKAVTTEIKGFRKKLRHLADGGRARKSFNKYSHLKTQKKAPRIRPPVSDC